MKILTTPCICCKRRRRVDMYSVWCSVACYDKGIPITEKEFDDILRRVDYEETYTQISEGDIQEVRKGNL